MRVHLVLRAGALAVLAALPVSAAQTATPAGREREIPTFSDSPLVTPAAAFTPDGFSPESFFFSFGGGYVTGNATAYGCLEAPAYVPSGATLTDMFATVYDNDAARNVSIQLRRVDNFSGLSDIMASATTAGTFAGVQTISDGTILFPLVSQPGYSYYFTACLGSSSVRLYSARLYYISPLIFADGFESGDTSAWSSTTP